jgi:hypothetical protein
MRAHSTVRLEQEPENTCTVNVMCLGTGCCEAAGLVEAEADAEDRCCAGRADQAESNMAASCEVRAHCHMLTELASLLFAPRRSSMFVTEVKISPLCHVRVRL